jgi:hypothetical protein
MLRKPKFKVGDLLIEVKGDFKGDLNKVLEVKVKSYYLHSITTGLKYHWAVERAEDFCKKLTKKQIKLAKLFYGK